MPMPPFIAVCGWPTAGKSTLQGLLQARYGYQIQDDGRVLRAASKALYGLSEWHVTTQEGKNTSVRVCGKEHLVRDLLGQLGKRMEEMHGPFFMPEAALRDCLNPYVQEDGSFSEATPLMSFGSVRMSQPWFYREHGGLVVAVRRPGLTAPSDSRDFDRFDPESVQVWIDNPGDTLRNFEQVAIRILDPILGEAAPSARKAVTPPAP